VRQPEPIAEEEQKPVEWKWRDSLEPDPRLPEAAREPIKNHFHFAALAAPELFEEMEQHKLDALKELKQVLKHELETTPSQYPEVIGDVRLLRFLKGFQYNVQEVAEVIRTSLQWRVENKVDEIRNHIVDGNLSIEDIPNWAVLSQYWRLQMFRSQDREGNPIVYDPLGSLKVHDLLDQVSKEDILLTFTYLMEYRMLLLDRMSRQARRLVFVYEIKDIAGLGSHVRHAMDVVKAIGHLTASNYVETVRRVSVINTPFVFKALYGLVNPLIPERTVHKIRILGAGGTELAEDIEQHAIDPDHRLFDARPNPKPMVRPAKSAPAAAAKFQIQQNGEPLDRPNRIRAETEINPAPPSETGAQEVHLKQRSQSEGKKPAQQLGRSQSTSAAPATPRAIKTHSPKDWWIGLDPGLVLLGLMLTLVMLWMLYNVS
jgi:hypothetical protein